jgi:circadian clock protein KaiB
VAVNGETYTFRLFVAGSEPNSMLARQNLTRLCETYLKGRHRVEIVDVFTSAAAALAHRVLVTPTLMVIKPSPGATLLGNLSDTSQVLAALRLNGHQP